jgi:hypothetical protein
MNRRRGVLRGVIGNGSWRDDALPVGQHYCANPNHVHAPDRFQTP